MDIYRSCLLNGVNIDMQWIPRDLNSVADDISKFIDYDDYMMNDAVFNAFDDLWGPHTCNRFACSYNAKIQCFNSRFYQPTVALMRFLRIGLITLTGYAPSVFNM